ncbi:right-handed parallel beta-helix repeat-containing protein [Pseudoalteromonas sp. Z9A5]|uniref:right-handed parallel beta-helix repeat-containing protein n=1 Tax=Pseudoalteromonas sp. Z9A5 TaxID=2686355 RepID=UPI001407A2BC|nr:right-handed parallel beta-helix repeat-containing protein [Pseudoalteromonas sp. Z9A5]
MPKTLYFFVLISFSADTFAITDLMLPNDGIDDSQAFKNLILNTPEDGEVIIEKPGIYDICSTVSLNNLNKISISAKSGVILKKCNNFNGEYLMTVYHSSFINIEGFTFKGLTNAQNSYVWGEQGLLVAGSSDITVDHNQFFDFGDAALRVTSSRWSSDTSPINSYRILVKHNYFRNVTQVTTTHPWSKNYGGTHDITFRNNIFENLRGSLKLASRKPVSKALVEHNTFRDMKGTAIELTYYSDVKITGNTFVNLDNFALNAFANKPENVDVPINWGNITFTDNSIINAKGGIRIKSDGHDELVDETFIKGIHITNNHFLDVDMTIYSEDKYKNLINFLSDGIKEFNSSTVENNLYNLPLDVKFLRKANLVEDKNNISIEKMESN